MYITKKIIISLNPHIPEEMEYFTMLGEEWKKSAGHELIAEKTLTYIADIRKEKHENN